MRLLKLNDVGDICLTKVPPGGNPPPYAILSHTWGAEEVSFDDLKDGTGKDKLGYRKIRFCGMQADLDNLKYFWVDTCCIDKRDSVELNKTITSMFSWYRNAARCYAYLEDVSTHDHNADGKRRKHRKLDWMQAFRSSKWFTRGWTLQELIAPACVQFFSKQEVLLGDKTSLEREINCITRIPVAALRGDSLSDFSVDTRLEWIKGRVTTLEEDRAYSLQGIFNVSMLPNYGETEESAFRRLKEEIRKAEWYKTHPDADLFSDATFNAPIYVTQNPGQVKRESPVVAEQRQERKREVLDLLRFDEIDARQMTIKKAHAKTCRWLLKKSEFLDWLDPSKLNEHHGFLWIKGKPGAGKSTLMKFALADARRRMKDKITISFFFNARGDILEKSTNGMYRSLLRQIVEQLPELPSVFDIPKVEPEQWSTEVWKDLFGEAVQCLGECSLMCFIDALDECDEDQIRDMLSFFEGLGELAMSGGSATLQVCFSSRHYPHITIKKGLSLILEGQEGHEQDIGNYLDTELNIGRGKTAKEIRFELREKAAGVFMWVVLVVGILNKEYDHGRIHSLRRKLEDIPGDLHELLRDMLKRDDHNRDELLLCIQWVLFTRKPLKPKQLYFAIISGVSPGDLSIWDPNNISECEMEKFILHSSKGLTEVTKSKSQTVQFIHESVKDFLLKERGLAEIWPDLGINFQGKSHERLKQSCLAYMSVDMAGMDIDNSLSGASSEQTAETVRRVDGGFPFLEYAVRNVLYHADAAQGGDVSQASFLQSFHRAEWIRLDNLFEKHKVRRHKDPSLAYIFAEQNLANLVRRFPAYQSFFEVEHERYGAPIFAALATGSHEAILAFLEAQAEDEHSTFELRNLCQQHSLDRDTLAKFRREFTFSRRKGILYHILQADDAVLLALCLALTKHDVDWAGDGGRTPLCWAVVEGREAVVNLLLEKGANIEAVDPDGRTPLSQAVTEGHGDVVKLLLERAANIEAVDKDGRTPLSWAVTRGFNNAFERLLEWGANIEAVDQDGRTPLSWAVTEGHGDVVKRLLKKGANIEAADQYGCTPLSQAVTEGHGDVVKLLLERAANIEAVDKGGCTPLSRAAIKGREVVVELLLKKGANIEAVDQGGRTPLSWAAIKGREVVVELLLKKGANIEAADKSGRTPLLWAVTRGFNSAFERLLEWGANIEAVDQDGRTPLSWAVTGHREDVIKLLFQWGANIEAVDQNGRTPLWWAVKNIEWFSKGVIEILLEKGANTEVTDGSGTTLRSLVERSEIKAVVQLFRDKF